MGLIVQKYGGTSVADMARIRKVAERVAGARREGHEVVAVISAMAGTTDQLLAWAQALAPDPDLREVDMLLSSGERVTSALVAIALRGAGVAAHSLSGEQVGIRTDEAHTRARVRSISAERLREALAAGEVPVVAGFQGVNERQEVTTLGRGGSDLSAIALAAALGAERCQIYTDVGGVYTADPALVPGARRLERISYDEMMELATLGARVLQSRAVELAKKFSVPIQVLSSFEEGGGTLVTAEEPGMEEAVVSAVSCDRDIGKVTILGVPDRPGIAARLFGLLGEAGIVVDLIVQNVSERGLTDISFTVPRADLARAEALAREAHADVGAQGVTSQADVAKVSIVGVGMKSQSGVAARMFGALAGEGINIMMITTSDISVSCVIEAQHTGHAVRAIHDAFGLAGGSG
ncbi:MAG: aspartate kinase [Nitrospinota bacterium]